jgi:hypothetical protein
MKEATNTGTATASKMTPNRESLMFVPGNVEAFGKALICLTVIKHSISS